MLAHLLESEKRSKRSVWGALVSTIAHATAIGSAVVATAHARMDDRKPAEIVRWIQPPVTPAVAPAAPATRTPPRPGPSTRVPLLALDRIDVVLPPIELAVPAPTYDAVPLTRGETIPGATPDSASGIASTEPYSAEQVERQVSLRQGGRSPRYPAALRDSGIDGEVVALFVVSEAGRVEPASVRFVRSDHALFETAVRDALGAMRFNAAKVGGRKVRQLVQMPFVFTLSR